MANNVNLIENIIEHERNIRNQTHITVDDKVFYNNLSMILNVNGIQNKVLNTLDIFGINDHPFMLIDVNEENGIFYLLDESINKFDLVTDELFYNYLLNLEINSNLNIRKIFKNGI